MSISKTEHVSTDEYEIYNPFNGSIRYTETKKVYKVIYESGRFKFITKTYKH